MDGLSALGAVSLGLAALKQLLDYYGKLKHIREDIQDTYARIQDLDLTLKDIERLFKELPPTFPFSSRAVQYLQRFRETLEKLVRKVKKVHATTRPSQDASQGFRSKAKLYGQGLIYPLLPSTIARLRELVDELSQDIVLALSTIQFSTSAESLNLLKKLADNSEKGVESLAPMTSLARDILAQTNSNGRHIQQLLDDKEQSGWVEKIWTWLKPSEPRTNHDNAQQKFEADTGLWLLEDQRYQEWKAGETKQLLVLGKAGACKTVLCSHIIEDVASSIVAKNEALLYFYLSFDDTGKQRYSDLLRSLLYQFVRRKGLILTLREAYKEHAPDSRPDSVLEGILAAYTATVSRTFVVVDALDEHSKDIGSARSFLGGLKRICGMAKVSVLMTSRPEMEIKQTVLSWPAVPLYIDDACVNRDIHLYVSNELERHSKLQMLPTETKERIKSVFIAKAGGMFRWAFCQLSEIKSLQSYRPTYVTEALTCLPSTLDETYETMLNNINLIHREEAVVALRWLCFSTRQLTLEELSEACITNPNARSLVDVANRGPYEDILSMLTSLVEVTWDGDDPPRKNSQAPKYEAPSRQSEDCNALPTKRNRAPVSHRGEAAEMRPPKNAVIRLAHFSVKEYLISSRLDLDRYNTIASEAQFFLAQSCAAYIVASSKSENVDDAAHRPVSDFPLLQYASEYWYSHQLLAEEIDVRAGEGGLHLDLLQSNDIRTYWLKSWCRGDYRGYFRHASPLGFASMFGLTSSCRFLLNNGCDVNEVMEGCGTALICACEGGHKQIAVDLVAKGAKADFIDASEGFIGSALHLAMRWNNPDFVPLLVRGGADINAVDPTLGTALQYACSESRDRVVEALLENGADRNLIGDRDESPLQAAAYSGSEHIVRLLIKDNVHIRRREGPHGSALEAASSRGHETVIKLLLDHGAAIEHRDQRPYSALYSAVGGKAGPRTLQLLLDNGADIGFRAGLEGDVLALAAEQGEFEKLEMLLGKDPDYSSVKLALEIAERCGRDEIVELLMDKVLFVQPETDSVVQSYAGASESEESEADEEIPRDLS